MFLPDPEQTPVTGFALRRWQEQEFSPAAGIERDAGQKSTDFHIGLGGKPLQHQTVIARPVTRHNLFHCDRHPQLQGDMG
ncbi:hypothetical protein [Sphingobium lactosutens]|uniref:hypothetical protein n=1 Tax=Sphingobium lactosutens TaxID=522773 RepID=UPI0015BB69EC|nr:hypothetical protein [Sphingobium lactosutens]